jgi:hypothetical protein
MESGKLITIIALALGFTVGYKWPKIKKQINPMLKQARKYSNKQVQNVIKVFTGRNSAKKVVRRAAARATA